MAKPEWGRKRTCQVCGKKYYDFNKSPIICPCPEAVEFDSDLLLRSRKGRGLSSKAMCHNFSSVPHGLYKYACANFVSDPQDRT